MSPTVAKYLLPWLISLVAPWFSPDSTLCNPAILDDNLRNGCKISVRCIHFFIFHKKKGKIKGDEQDYDSCGFLLVGSHSYGLSVQLCNSCINVIMEACYTVHVSLFYCVPACDNSHVLEWLCHNVRWFGWLQNMGCLPVYFRSCFLMYLVQWQHITGIQLQQ